MMTDEKVLVTTAVTWYSDVDNNEYCPYNNG